MRSQTKDRLKGTFDLLALRVLASQGRMHGSAITLRIEGKPSPTDAVLVQKFTSRKELSVNAP